MRCDSCGEMLRYQERIARTFREGSELRVALAIERTPETEPYEAKYHGGPPRIEIPHTQGNCRSCMYRRARVISGRTTDVPLGPSNNQPVAHQSKRELLDPILERWERGDFSVWDECFAPDLLVTGFDADGSHQAHGPKEITSYLSRFFRQFRDYRIQVGPLDQLSEEIVLMEGRQLGTGRLSGVDIAETLYIVFRFASGRLTEMHWHPKREGALAAAGLAGEPPEAR